MPPSTLSTVSIGSASTTVLLGRRMKVHISVAHLYSIVGAREVPASRDRSFVTHQEASLLQAVLVLLK